MYTEPVSCPLPQMTVAAPTVLHHDPSRSSLSVVVAIPPPPATISLCRATPISEPIHVVKHNRLDITMLSNKIDSFLLKGDEDGSIEDMKKSQRPSHSEKEPEPERMVEMGVPEPEEAEESVQVEVSGADRTAEPEQQMGNHSEQEEAGADYGKEGGTGGDGS
ncbi:hypothetical protein SASPL_145672 [Salvia splendens]|uniref:Uncharacterized protein n=1 Tax=Salvia splendens TaxID=180675 RepID=A0A8X8Z7W5_SALSN|nr:hypothetical protein SASPL_145672 [Salvia splendens]